MRRSATVVLLNSTGQVLLILRDDGAGKLIPYPNMWDIPGGGAEGDETSLDCAIREMKEELELDMNAQECVFLFTYNHDNTIDDFYLYRVPPNTRLVQHEGADMKWMPLDEIKKLELAWGANEILPLLEEKLAHLA